MLQIIEGKDRQRHEELFETVFRARYETFVVDRGDFDIIHFEPGDILVHHFRTIHGTGGNRSRYQVRRAASIRYCGDDIRFKERPWAPQQLHHTYRLHTGDPRGGSDFPIVWERQTQEKAA